ncbi:alpha/beta fold hydrolase [bacterium]|nr:alpha/beta fold hydrolase [bacterium]
MTVLRKAVVLSLVTVIAVSCARLDKQAEEPVRTQRSSLQMPDISKGWRMHTGDDESWMDPRLDEAGWSPIELGKSWEDQGLAGYDGYAWYRLQVRVSEALKQDRDFRVYRTLILNLGLIDDVDETWFNGKRIGGTGSFPDAYSGAWMTPRTYRIPARLIRWDQDNVLSVRVYDGGGPGGFYQGPYSLKVPTWEDYFKIKIDGGQGDGIFPRGTPMRIAATVQNQARLDMRGRLRWKVESDEGNTLAASETGLAIGSAESVMATSDYRPFSPGFYKVTCTFEDVASDRSVSTSMILGHEPESIYGPLTREPDFHAFWRQTLEELRQIDPQFRMIPQPEGSSETHKVYLVEMRSLGNVLVRGWYETPKTDGRHPAILRVPGYGASMGPARSSDEVIVFSFNIRGHGNSQDDVRGEPEDFWIRGLDNKNDYFYRGAFMDCVRAVDFLASRPEVDRKRIAVTGASQGGGLSLITAALDKRISLCAPDIPFLCNYDKYFKASHWPEMDQWIAAKPDRSWATTLRTMSYFDTLNFASEIRCPVFLGVGLQDTVCPAATIFAVYNRLQGPKEYRVYAHAGHNLGATGHRAEQRAWLRRHFEQGN